MRAMRCRLKSLEYDYSYENDVYSFSSDGLKPRKFQELFRWRQV